MLKKLIFYKHNNIYNTQQEIKQNKLHSIEILQKLILTSVK